MWRRVMLLCVLLCAVPALAVVLRSGGTVTIGSGQVINDDLVVSGGTVRLLGEVTGDVVVAGGTVEINGQVGGSLMVAAGNVTVNGPIGGSVYAAAGTVDMRSAVGRNAVVTAGTFTGGSAANVTRDLALSAGTVTLAGTVGRNMRATAGTLTLEDGARVGGDLTAQTSSPEIAPGAVVEGEQRITRPERQPGARVPGVVGWVVWHLLATLALLLTGLVFIALAPRLTGETVAMLRAHPWGSLLAGLIVLLVTPLAVVVAVFTLLGIPLALITLALYLIALYLAPIFVAVLVGLWVLRRRDGSLVLALVIGLALLLLVRLVPILGFLTMLAALLFGLGALVLALQARSANPLFGGRREEERPEAV